MSDTEVRDESLLRTIIVSLSCAVIGLGIIVGASFLGNGSLAREVLQEFATILMVSGGVGVILDLFTRHSIVRALEFRLQMLLTGISKELKRVSDETQRVADSNAVANRAEAVGLNDVITSNHVLNPLIESRLINASEITIIMNDGRTWISWMQQALRRRLTSSAAFTRFVFLDPASSMVEIQARKENRTPAQVIDKIDAALSSIASLAADVGAEARVEVWVHDLFNTHTIWLDTELAVVALYNLTPGLADTIAFAFADQPGNTDSTYGAISADVKALLESRHARCLYPMRESDSSRKLSEPDGRVVKNESGNLSPVDRTNAPTA